MIPNEQYWFQSKDLIPEYKKLYSLLSKSRVDSNKLKELSEALDDPSLTVRVEAEYLDDIQEDIASLRYHLRAYLEDLCEESIDAPDKNDLLYAKIKEIEESEN